MSELMNKRKEDKITVNIYIKTVNKINKIQKDMRNMHLNIEELKISKFLYFW